MRINKNNLEGVDKEVNKLLEDVSVTFNESNWNALRNKMDTETYIETSVPKSIINVKGVVIFLFLSSVFIAAIVLYNKFNDVEAVYSQESVQELVPIELLEEDSDLFEKRKSLQVNKQEKAILDVERKESNHSIVDEKEQLNEEQIEAVENGETPISKEPKLDAIPKDELPNVIKKKNEENENLDVFW